MEFNADQLVRRLKELGFDAINANGFVIVSYMTDRELKLFQAVSESNNILIDEGQVMMDFEDHQLILVPQL